MDEFAEAGGLRALSDQSTRTVYELESTFDEQEGVAFDRVTYLEEAFRAKKQVTHYRRQLTLQPFVSAHLMAIF